MMRVQGYYFLWAIVISSNNWLNTVPLTINKIGSINTKIDHQVNSRIPISLVTCNNELLSFIGDLLHQPPYSPELAKQLPFIWQKFMIWMQFQNQQVLYNYLEQFLDNKLLRFLVRGIVQFVKRWEQVILNNGQYIVD